MINNFVSKLKNFHFISDTELGLNLTEIDVILAVLDKIFEREGYPKKGTFRIEGQMDGHGALTIFEFNFPGGEQKHFLGGYRGSDVVASQVLYDGSTYEKKREQSAITYLYNSPEFVKLNTDCGRFLIAFFADNGSISLQTLVYMAVIETLTRLREDDNLLKTSSDLTFFTEVEDMPELSNLRRYIDGLFDNEKLPEIVEWSEWYEDTKEYYREKMFCYFKPEEHNEEDDDDEEELEQQEDAYIEEEYED